MVYDRDPQAKQIQYIHEYLGLDNRNVLEVGCGDGYLMRRYITPNTHIIGIDANLEVLTQAKNQANTIPTSRMDFAYANAEHIPFPNQYFERVIFGLSL